MWSTTATRSSGPRNCSRRRASSPGVSAGAIAAIAHRIGGELDSGNVVFLIPDDGWKYLSSGVYTKPIEEIENQITYFLRAAVIVGPVIAFVIDSRNFYCAVRLEVP